MEGRPSNGPSPLAESTTVSEYLSMDPDLLEGNSCVLFQLLRDESPSIGPDRLSSVQQSKTTLERIGNWSIPTARAEALSSALLKTSLDIEVLKEAQALVPAHIGETFASDVVKKWRAEAEKWKIELLKGIVFKLTKDIVRLEEAAQELKGEAGQKNAEMDTSRKNAQDYGGTKMDIEAVRREVVAKTQSKVASSMAAMTAKAKDDERRIELLQKQLAEKSKATEILETRVRATVSRVASSLTAVTKKANDDELRTDSLQKQLADKSKATEILKTKVKAIASRLASSITAATRKAKDDEWNIEMLRDQRAACERAEEDLLLLVGNEDLPMTEDLMDFPDAKRTKWRSGANDVARVKVAGDEEVVAKQQSKENRRKDISVGNDSGNHVKRGVGANSGEEVVDGRRDQIPQQQVLRRTPSQPFAPFASKQDSDHVQEPGFYDFDALRTENDILSGQVWAIYDDQNAMPRFYARISRVTTTPFRAHVTWLEHDPATEEERVWTGSTGLAIACGDFKMDRADVIDQINSFSHLVMDNVGSTLLKIYPKKGEVWAVYKDPEQGTGPAGGPRFHIQRSTPKFEMVGVLSEFCGKEGLRTVKLVKVTGFRSVFRRQDGIESFRSFKPEELLKFSHSVPNQRIHDSQTAAHGIPCGSLELDLAATPVDLRSIQIVHPG